MTTAPTPQRTVILQDDALRRLQGFTQLPNVVLKHPTISYGAKVAFGVLLSYAWQDDFCWPAQDRLANDLSCSVRQVQRLLKELKDASFIEWKQQGLNKPNVYYLLPMTKWSSQKSAKHADTTDLSYPGTTEVSRPEATHPSLLEATDLSHKEDSTKKIQSNVNVVHKTISGSHRLNPAISDTALVNRYHLTPEQIDETRRLVDLQISVLGAGDRNHAAYVQRAAEAVRDGTTHAMQTAIGEVKDTAHRKAIGSLPGYFTRVYEAMRAEALRPVPEPIGPPPAVAPTEPSDPDLYLKNAQRERLLEGISAKGYPIPAHIRHASAPEIAAWYDDVERTHHAPH